MKMHIKNQFLRSLVVVAFGLVMAAHLAAQTFTTLHNFTAIDPVYGTNTDGVGPNAMILLGDTLYGVAQAGGSSAIGTVFKVNTNGTGFANLHSFAGSDGAYPTSGLALSGNTLYGTAAYGGISGNGTVFAINTDGQGFTVLHVFSGGDGADPVGVILSGTTLFGATRSGGSPANGTLFKVNTDGTGFTNIHIFAASTGDVSGNPINSDGANPSTHLILSGDTLYGTTYSGGSSARGTVFKVNTDGTGFETLHVFTDADGGYPDTPLVLSGSILYVSSSFAMFRLSTNGTGFIFIFSIGHAKTAAIASSGNTVYGLMGPGVQSPTTYTVVALSPDGNDSTTIFTFDWVNRVSVVSSLLLSGNGFFGTIIGSTPDSDSVFALSFTPQLAVVPSGQNVSLSWPTNYAGFDYSGYTLQSTTDLSSPVWNTNSPVPVVVNGQNTVTNFVSGTQRFFRLSQ